MRSFLLNLILMISFSLQAEVVEIKSSLIKEPGSSLTLMDLVEERKNSEIDSIREKLRSTVVMTLQEAGDRVELSLESIAGHLRMVLDSQERQEFKFSIPRRVEVLIQSLPLTEEVVKSQLSQKWNSLCHPCKVEIRDLQLPIGQFDKWKLVISSELPKGSFNIPLSVESKGLERRYWIQGKVEILKEVPVAQRALYIGERLKPTDFKYEWRNVTFASDGPPPSSFIVGAKVKLPVSVDQIVWNGNLEREKALRRGEQVRVYSSSGAWELSVAAVAEKDAEVGDVITLKNPTTQRLLTGQVVGKGEVEIK